MVQEISSGQTFVDISNLFCDLGLEHSNPIFHIFLFMMLYHKCKFASKQIKCLEDIVETVIF